MPVVIHNYSTTRFSFNDDADTLTVTYEDGRSSTYYDISIYRVNIDGDKDVLTLTPWSLIKEGLWNEDGKRVCEKRKRGMRR
jgi:hypothetical protein